MRFNFNNSIQILPIQSSLGIPVGLSDEQIGDLIAERKELPENYLTKLTEKPKSNRRHSEAEILIVGDKGHKFVLAIRRSVDNPKSFSVMLRYLEGKNGKPYILMRCNGSHDHTNQLEKETIRGFHIHIATKRYLDLDDPKASYAQATSEYSSYTGALDTLIRKCGFRIGKNMKLDDFRKKYNELR